MNTVYRVRTDEMSNRNSSWHPLKEVPVRLVCVVVKVFFGQINRSGGDLTSVINWMASRKTTAKTTVSA